MQSLVLVKGKIKDAGNAVDLMTIYEHLKTQFNTAIIVIDTHNMPVVTEVPIFDVKELVEFTDYGLALDEKAAIALAKSPIRYKYFFDVDGDYSGSQLPELDGVSPVKRIRTVDEIDVQENNQLNMGT